MGERVRRPGRGGRPLRPATSPSAGHPHRRPRLPGPEPESRDQTLRRRRAGVRLRARPVADLDPSSKFAIWEDAVANPMLARVLFQTASTSRESPRRPLRRGRRPAGRHRPVDRPPRRPRDDRGSWPDRRAPRPAGLALSRARSGRDGARPLRPRSPGRPGWRPRDDESGRLLAFGAILRHDAASLPPGATAAEGARTTAALVASHFGDILKISQDGVVSCFLDGARVWDL